MPRHSILLLSPRRGAGMAVHKAYSSVGNANDMSISSGHLDRFPNFNSFNSEK
ncbi:hypothetical protein BRAS3843_2460014 [Bradyrhizobium sp. STM 3843]|nr:hypothetical protein BRAS3843_2460014 [Bradyrhizobium sp. STM 3843]